MNQVFLSLGSNIGNRLENIKEAITLLVSHPEINLIKESSIYETEPFGYTEQSDFLNMVINISTGLTPLQLLEYIQDIEGRLGRTREIHWGPRTIDIDILLIDDKIIKNKKLQVPHPYITKRLFVLVPLIEIYEGNIPGESLAINDLINRLEEKEGVIKLWEI